MKNKLELTEFEKRLLSEYIESWDYIDGEKGTMLILKLKNGFEVVGTSEHGLVSRNGYGRFNALRNALDNLDSFISFEKHQKAYKHYLSLKEEKELKQKSLEMFEEDMKKVDTSLFEKSEEVSGAEAHRMTDQEFRDDVIGKGKKKTHSVRTVSANGLIVTERFLTSDENEEILSAKRNQKITIGSIANVTIIDTKTGEEVFKMQNIPSSSIEFNVDEKEAEHAMKEDIWLQSRYGYRVRPEVTSKSHDIDFAGMSSRLLSKDDDTDVHIEEEKESPDGDADNSSTSEDEGDSLTEQMPMYNTLESTPPFFKKKNTKSDKEFTQKELLEHAFLRMLNELEASGEDMESVTFSLKIKGKDEK